jgi:hypothetical protein
MVIDPVVEVGIAAEEPLPREALWLSTVYVHVMPFTVSVAA